MKLGDPFLLFWLHILLYAKKRIMHFEGHLPIAINEGKKDDLTLYAWAVAIQNAYFVFMNH